MERKKVETQREYIILAAYGLFFIVFGFLTDTPRAIAEGLYQIISEPDILITDYFGMGGIGASFVNLGIIGLISIGILYALKINVTGASISAIWLMFGFALFGKDILNIWVIIGGVWLYSRYQKESFARYVYIALFGTSLAPIVTLIIFQFGLPYPLGIPLGILIGVGVGFILPPLAGYMMRFHQGFNLYNIGFTAGIIGTVLISLFKSFGFAIESRLIWTTDNNSRMALFLEILLLSMIVLSFILDRNVFRKYRRLFQYNGRLVTDFVMLEGFAPTLLNMGINGSVATLYVLIVGGALNGPTIGGILTIVGFSAFGKHLKNILPIFVGVALPVTVMWQMSFLWSV